MSEFEGGNIAANGDCLDGLKKNTMCLVGE